MSFSWIPIYKELAPKILEYREKQDELIAFVKTMKEKDLLTIRIEDADQDGPIPLGEIDPFTFYANFNKRMKDVNRRNILQEIKAYFALRSDIPEDFEGIPVVRPDSAWFFGWKKKRTSNDIPNLWSLASQVLQGGIDGIDEALFNDCLDVKGIGLAKLTMGMFWLAPGQYLAADSTNMEYLDNRGIALKGESYNSYKQLLSEVRQKWPEEEYWVLSNKAYVERSQPPSTHPPSEPRYWLMSPGEDARLWDDFKRNKTIAIGGQELGDLRQYADKDAIKKKLAEIYPGSKRSNDALACYEFTHEMKAGDYVFMKKGTKILLGMGRITSDYALDAQQEYPHIREVDWLAEGSWAFPSGIRAPVKMLTNITGRKELVEALKSLAQGENDPGGVKEHPGKTSWSLNSIYYGPPGTGKTFAAIHKAVEICDGRLPQTGLEMTKRFKELQSEGRIAFITFHQSYGYEEFVEGIRPVLVEESRAEGPSSSDSVQYELHIGVFKQLCMGATAEPSKKKGSYDFDPDKVRIWKMSLGNTLDPNEAIIYEDCINQGYAWLGYGRGLDFSGCDTRQAVWEKLKSVDDTIENTNYNVTSVHMFKNDMSIGDLIVVSDGNRKFRAIGKVTGEYKPPIEGDRGQRRPVEWLVTYEESLPRERILNGAFSQMTLYQFGGKSLKVDALKELLSGRKKDSSENKHVLVIDEINRGNMSKVLGELITLIEPDKRIGGDNEIQVTLPYSGETFGVPRNLYIIGTMNTADRSIAFMDTALRRRFKFVEMMPDYDIIASEVDDSGKIDGVSLPVLLRSINDRIEALFDRDHQVGHSYFLEIRSLEELRDVFLNDVIPLLQEYFYDDWEKLCAVLGCPYDPETGKPTSKNEHPIILSEVLDVDKVMNSDYDEHESRIRCQVNKKFSRATGDALRDFFNALIGAGSSSTNTAAE